jgi:hypothetical protein
MKIHKHHILIRLFCILMAFHIFNMSVDTRDANPDSEPEDLSYNDMESVVEIVIEKVLGYDNAIAEHDEEDEDSDKSFEIAKDLKIQGFYICYFSPRYPTNITATETPYNGEFCSDYTSEITPPPPKC